MRAPATCRDFSYCISISSSGRVHLMVEVSLLTAFIAGIFSISSPCVLPLIPIYLTHIAGVSAGGSDRHARAIVLRNAVAYVLGFSIVFICLLYTSPSPRDRT